MADEALIDRDELRASARDMLADLSNPAAVRERIEHAGHGNDPLWPRLVEVGWTGIAIGEDDAGAGASFADLAVVLVELGRHLAPATLFASTVLAAGALELAGSTEPRGRWLPGLADGSLRGTAALTDVDGRIDVPGLAARRDGEEWVLDGTAGYVPAATGADLVVLRASGPDGELLAAVPGDAPGLEVTPAPMLDLTRSFDDVAARGVRVGRDMVLATGPNAEAVSRALLNRAAIAVACDSLGIVDEVLSRTVDYVKQREQFDRPIGSFQAVKHRCTDMLIAAETTRLIVTEAGEAVQGGAEAVAASRAKSYATDAAARAAADSIQLHGGIGVTWEHDAHLFLKRAALNQALYGDPRWHRRQLAALTLPARA